jgi:hypothetical protein
VAVAPWAEVSLDARSLGVTPLRPIDLLEGTHVVSLANRDLGITVRRRVTVRPHRETLLSVDLFAEDR